MDAIQCVMMWCDWCSVCDTRSRSVLFSLWLLLVSLSGMFGFVVVFATMQFSLVVECFAGVDDVGITGPVSVDSGLADIEMSGDGG